MKDKDWCKEIEAEINSLKERVNKLEGHRPASCTEKKDVIELEVVWPEMDIEGLHFDAVATHAAFALKEDGNYYSRDILFNSARDTDERTGRDLLSEYLDSDAVKKELETALAAAGSPANVTSVFIPKENQGMKKYNGVSWWYWLKPPYSGSSSVFCDVDTDGSSDADSASAVGGCAPAFCVGDNRHE